MVVRHLVFEKFQFVSLDGLGSELACATSSIFPQAFAVSTPSTWNSLSVHFVLSTKYNTFRSQLKTYLVQAAVW